jgi:hypothetical protein
VAKAKPDESRVSRWLMTGLFAVLVCALVAYVSLVLVLL